MQRASLPASLTLRDPISTDHSFVNYSIPLHDSSPSSLPTLEQPRRPVPAGSADARLRELENEIEKLTLSNIRLLRTNRILKLDCDRIVDEQTSELREEIAHLRHQNVRLQRNNRLLQDDLKQRMQEMNQMRDDQIRKMKNVGPEYEYLVQMINLLYRQLQGKSTCDETCCFTNKPLDQGFSVLTLPPESEEQRPEPQHICRPSVQSHISGGSLACAAQQEIAMLRQELEEMRNDKENLYDMLHEKEDDLETLKCELKMKDNIVTQLEKDFERMELEVVDLQKDWRHPGDRIKSHTSFSDIHAFPIPPPLPKD
ncbi:hypothetical protein BCR43DRAFT_497139 [Syncephalastrum racemosum]|uniref:Uncharacterized protein n=1 Tax=Syncephalastrum racemosum TaxID=13706 RepID=A0A1X2H571_SYNRA|nr:hypothetical protein BCR43DRAFT_497139 [Syncephalastrum racemosum]